MTIPYGISELIAAGCALVSLVGAGIAWWRANLSAAARREAAAAQANAEAARDTAKKHLDAAELLAKHVEELAGSLRPPVLSAVYSGKSLTLTNGTAEDITLTGLDADEYFERQLRFPVTIAAHDVYQTPFSGHMNLRVPDQLRVLLDDGRSVLVGVRRPS